MLHLAIIGDHTQTIKYLLRNAKFDMMANLNKQCIDLARKHGHLQLFQNLQQLFDSLNRFPVHTFSKTFLIGNSITGKTYLANKLRKTDIKITNAIDESTDAGIVPSLVENSKIGNIVLYDLAGQAQYHFSHSAVMETVMHQSPATFIIVVDLNNTDNEIIQQLCYWLNFIDNATTIKSSLIIVGSHNHVLSHEQVQSKSAFINEEMQKRSILQEYMGYVTVDCQNIESAANQEFMSILNKSNQSIVARLPPISCFCHLLYAFLMEQKLNMQISTLKGLSMPKIIPSEVEFIAEILEILSERGLIIFLKNHQQLENSWIIVNIELLLKIIKKEVLLVLEEFKDHRLLGSNTGIIRSSVLKQLFPKFDIEMLVGFMQNLQLCYHVTLSGNSTNLQHFEAFSFTAEDEEDINLFFPSLLTNFQKILFPINEDSCFGWCLYCNKTEDQYFTSEFLHVLLLRLAYSFPMASSNHSQSKCTVWTNGIYWDNVEEINTTVELINHNRCVMVVMSHNNSRPVEFSKHRSAVIRLVLDLKQQLCPDVQAAEYLTSRFYLRKWSSSESVSPPSKSELLPIENVATSMLQRKPFIFASSGIISELRTKDALKYEPYYRLSPSTVCELMDSSKADEPVSQSLLDEVERICQIKQLKQPSHSQLRLIVDGMSIYAGKNPIVS